MADQQLIDIHGVCIPTSTHPRVRALKRKASARGAHGNKVWDSAKVLIDYLEAYPPQKALRILELGGGWGVVSSFLAKHYSARVVSLDIDPDVQTYAELVAELNGVEFDTVTMDFADIEPQHLTQFDLIVGADICFWEQLPPLVADVINCAAQAEVAQVLIADPGRPPFYELAEWAQEEYDAELIEWHSRSTETRGYIINIS